MKISPARRAAFEILSKIEAEKAFSSVLLPIYEENLEAKDRALCHELTLGTLRKQIYLDRIIEQLTSGKKLDAAVRIILRIGLYQLIFLNKIPAHAAINDSVNLVQAAKKTSAKGFANAILRKFTRDKIILNFADEIEKLSIETSHPRWLIEKWIRQFGFDETAKLAAANDETPRLDFRFTAKTSEAVKKSLRQERIENEKNYLRELADGGKIYFQDAASQMVAEAVDLQPKESFLDVCCAPASKFSMINFAVGGVPQKLFVGGDLYLQRLKIARKTCEKTGAKNYQILAYDAEKSLPFADESFDVALLDAPCSGTGTIRHNPEIRYFLRENDFRELSAKQLEILKNASKVLRRGGRLIYSTCSLEPEENEQVIEKFLDKNRDFRKAQIRLPQQFLTKSGAARTFPPRDKTDGFFIAALEKLQKFSLSGV
ncbi:MAG: 16S rRNA (cytosine(967)-C(5))-methyltransferase RsmB [Pyrinomonadaceae bacterium]